MYLFDNLAGLMHKTFTKQDWVVRLNKFKFID